MPTFLYVLPPTCAMGVTSSDTAQKPWSQMFQVQVPSSMALSKSPVRFLVSSPAKGCTCLVVPLPEVDRGQGP